MIQQTIIKDGDVLLGFVRIADKKYEYTYFDTYKWTHVTVGYEDCPVGTDDSIYAISKIGSKWVVVFRDEVGEVGKEENDKLPVIYHEVDEKYNEVFEHGKIWSH